MVNNARKENDMSQTNNQRFYDLDFAQKDDGTIRLTQVDCGEDSIIDAHPEQILFVARRLCGMSSATAEQVQDLERKLSVVTDRLERLVTDDWFRKGIIEGCGDFAEMLARLDGIVDLAIEFDGNRLLPSDPEPEPEPKKESMFKPMKPPANNQQLDLPS